MTRALMWVWVGSTAVAAAMLAQAVKEITEYCGRKK